MSPNFLAEYYAKDNADEVFVEDFVEAWTMVVTLDRIDLNNHDRGEIMAGR